MQNSELLIELISQFPSIGSKTAERIAFFLMEKQNKHVSQELVLCLKTVIEKVTYCRKCFNFSESDYCSICSNLHRNSHTICVVDTPRDLISIEKTGNYKGLYHVLKNDLFSTETNTLDFLLRRITANSITEIIIACSANLNGAWITAQLQENLRHLDIKISRISIGIPLGSTIEFVSRDTLIQAINSRKPLNIS